MKNNDLKVWYYTTYSKIEIILEKGYIDPNDIQVSKYVTPASICTTNSEWDKLVQVSVL